MASFSDQVIYKTGDSTAYTTQMPQWLSDGVRDVVDRVLAINPGYERYFVTLDSILSSAGLSIDSQHVLRVYRNDSLGNNILAPMLPSGMFVQATDSGSIYAATEAHPVSYIHNGYVYTWPVPTSSAVVVFIDYGAVNDSAGTITNFPSSLYELVVLYAAMRAVEYRIATLRGEMRSYIDTDEDSELAQLKAGEIAKSEGLLGRLASEYASGFERVRGAA